MNGALELQQPQAGRSAGGLGVAVVGCGLIGQRRARTALLHPGTALRLVVDSAAEAAASLARGTCDASVDWRHTIDRSDVDVVVVATPNHLLAEIAIAALAAGKHVLMEKPMGRNLAEARAIHDAAGASTGVLHVGFNHRFHPAIRRALELVAGGAVGRVLNVRARYGHGGRPGLEHEWRSDPECAGGGELLDQGVHLADLIYLLCGMPESVFAEVQTAAWPIAPLEDNAYAIMRFAGGAIAQLHVSMTQWKNLFSFEVHGDAGAVIVDGLGGSYGVERLVRVERAYGGAPAMHEHRFDGEDPSWTDEWDAFVARIGGAPAANAPAGNAAQGLAAMRIIDALYQSASAGLPIRP